MMKQENLPLTSLRGVAALWVVAHHLLLRFIDTGLATPDRFLLPGGVAVDIFFILSGLVMAGTYTALTPAGVPAFMVRRVFRIYPLHLFVMAGIIGVALLRFFVKGQVAPGDNWARLPEALLLLQPFRDLPLTWNVASWSVGVEMACYLAFPLLLPLMRGLPRTLVIGLALVLGIVEFVVLSKVGTVVSGPGAVARGFAGFSFGMAMALSLRGVRLPPLAQKLAEPLAAIGVVAALAVSMPELTPVFAAALIGLFYIGRGPVAVLLEWAPLHWLGKISYSVYLTHLPVIGFAALLFAPQKMPLPEGVGLIAWSLVVMALVLAISHLCWRFVEEPARRYGARLSRGRLSPAVGASQAAGVA